MKKSAKIILGTIGAICAIGVIGNAIGVSNDSEDKEKKIVSVESSEEKSNKEIIDNNDNSSENSDDSQSSKENNELSETEEKANVSIDEQVLWEVDGVKITATGITEDTFWGSEVNLLVENNSDKDIGIGAEAVIVNDYMINDLTSIIVTAGNKTNDSITLFSSELEAAGIDNIGTIELYLYTFNPETYMTDKESGCITITTSANSVDTETDIGGVTLFEQDGVKIVGQYVDEDSFWGASVLLYIENNTDQNIIVQSGDVAINGYMITSLCSEHIYAHKKAITDITLLESDLESNGITSVDEIETEFKILDSNFNEIANSGKVKFSVE